ncbi:MAG TPA: hypothetical protein VGJ91_13575, partial [Polyangiaceae bacterium]
MVGEATDLNSILRVFRWTAAGGIEDLTSLLAAPYSLSGVSSNGAVLAGANAAGVFRWPVAGTLVTAPMLAGDTSCGSNVRLSDDGSVIVGVCRASSTSADRVIRWRQTGQTLNPEVLATPPGTNTAWPKGVNRNGTVVVGQLITDGSASSVRWTSAGMDTIAVPSGASAVYSMGVSADGLVVVGYEYTVDG